ncbi:MAG TPA: Ig-like domain-containing protein, partial [Actinomycetota bacterium]|nr:Ig-like domain-containing protein [Actinomycetota bacterium]
MARTLVITISAIVLLAFGAMTAAATTTTTPASGGTNVSADLAQNGVAPAYTTLGAIVLTEANNNDFKTSGTLVLTAPSGWQFNPAAAVTATPGKVGGGSTPNDISASVGAITASSITINITVTAAARLDNLTLGGIQVQAVEGGTLPVSGNMLRTSANPGTATIVGVSNDVTNFGSLSQAVGALRLFVVLPGQSLTDGATVASSGIAGAAPNQAAGVAFNLVELVAADRQFNVDATYSGAKTVAWSGPGGSPNYTTNVSFTSGHSTTTLATTLRKAELVALSATSATSPAIATGQPSASFAVDPGPAAKLQILLPGETAAPGTATGKTGAPTAQTSGVAMLNNVRVNAVDADWNMISSAAPDVAIGSSDVAAAIADDNGAGGGNLSLVAGSGTLSSFTFWTGGSLQTLSATDVAAALGAGTSASVTVNKPASATGLVSSQNPAVFGQSVTFTATVAGANGTPTGTVDFKDGASVIASALPLDGSGVASFSTSSLTAASHTISAVYSGSALYAASTSANLSQVVSKAGTATALVSSLNPACAGQAVTLTATVSVVAPGAGVPAGTVSFKDGSTVIGGSIALNASGVATFTTSALASGNRNLTVVYNGNANFSTSTSTPALVQAVKPKPTASVSGSTAICPGNSASIQAALGGTSPWTVTWSDGVVQSGVTTSPASRTVSPLSTTIYSVTSVADANCSNIGSGSATVTVNALPAISAQPSPKNVCAGN